LSIYFYSTKLKKFFLLEPVLILLTILLTLIIFNLIQIKQRNLLTFLSIGLTTIVLVFFAADRLLEIFIFFELSILPIFLMVIIAGYQSERLLARLRLMFYTFMASLPLILRILMLNFKFVTNFSLLINQITPIPRGVWLPGTLILAFLVKTPIYCTHIWLPKAHVEAPVYGSMVLAAILLKIGTYGFFLITTIFDKSNLALLFLALSIWGIWIVRLTCIKLIDIKVMIALSSVSHMALLLTIALLGFKIRALAAVLIIITHGFTSSGLFYNANQSYENSNSRNLVFNKGILRRTAPTIIWRLIIMSNIRAPPSLNFFAELLGILILLVIWSKVIFLLIFFIVLTSVYSYNLFRITTQTPLTQVSGWSVNKNFYLINSLHIVAIFYRIFLLSLT